jgi:RNA ligase (TIGR02306 family)
MPERPEFEFLRASSFKPAQYDAAGAVTLPAGFRIKTVKLRGQVSQGICFPLSILPPGAPTEEGADVTDLLGICKWEPPLPVGMGGRVKGGFPGFLPKTDETRVQVLEPVLERHRGKTFYVTEKLDGTSFTAFLREGEFGICSRNLWMDEADETNVLVRVARRLKLEEKLRAVRERRGMDVAIQAEVIGPGIQKNKYGLMEVTLRVFSVLDVGTYKLLDHAVSLDVVRELGLEPVPQLGTLELNHTVDELVEFAEGTSALNPKAQREGGGAATAGRGVRPGSRGAAELQGHQPEVPAEVRRVRRKCMQPPGGGSRHDLTVGLVSQEDLRDRDTFRHGPDGFTRRSPGRTRTSRCFRTCRSTRPGRSPERRPGRRACGGGRWGRVGVGSGAWVWPSCRTR